MRRSFVLTAVLASTLLMTLPAQAASVVQVQDFSFSPTPVTVPQGTSVWWHNNGPSNHTSTSDVGLWSTTTLTGKIRVPIEVSPASGGTSTVFTITLASGSRVHWSFDVQKKAGAGPWRIWKTGVTSLSVTFHRASPGTWTFRSRLHRNGSTLRTGWSPPKMITIS